MNEKIKLFSIILTFNINEIYRTIKFVRIKIHDVWNEYALDIENSKYFIIKYRPNINDDIKIHYKEDYII